MISSILLSNLGKLSKSFLFSMGLKLKESLTISKIILFTLVCEDLLKICRLSMEMNTCTIEKSSSYLRKSMNLFSNAWTQTQKLDPPWNMSLKCFPGWWKTKTTKISISMSMWMCYNCINRLRFWIKIWSILWKLTSSTTARHNSKLYAKNFMKDLSK